MYKAWAASAADGEALARMIEAHVNEFADEIISVDYAVDGDHHALVVYRTVEVIGTVEVAAVEAAEQIVEQL